MIETISFQTLSSWIYYSPKKQINMWDTRTNRRNGTIAKQKQFPKLFSAVPFKFNNKSDKKKKAPLWRKKSHQEFKTKKVVHLMGWETCQFSCVSSNVIWILLEAFQMGFNTNQIKVIASRDPNHSNVYMPINPNIVMFLEAAK